MQGFLFDKTISCEVLARMDAFMNWFFAFMTTMLQAIWTSISGFFGGLFEVFNFPKYFDQIAEYKGGFNILAWILAVLTIIIAYAIWAAVIFLIILAVRKYLRFRKTVVGNEDLLEEIADLHRDVVKLTADKERILNMKLDPTGLTYEELRAAFEGESSALPMVAATSSAATEEEDEDKYAPPEMEGKRFFRLSAVDDKYLYYMPPVYEKVMTLEQLCDDIRNFACSRSRLYYEKKVIRLMIAGLATTKLILLQGISGTGKT